MTTTATITTTSVPEWNPTTKSDIKLKDCLAKLAASLDPVMLTRAAPSLAEEKEKDKQQKKFLLQSKAYFDLKAYVLNGKEFPGTDDGFDKKISKEAFQRLEDLDQSIYKDPKNSLYDTTKKTMVGIGETCGAFYRDNLFQIVQAGDVAKTWTEATLENLQSKDDPALSLRAQLMVLCDLKYKKPADLDDAFNSAKDAAQTQLRQLEQTAIAKSVEANRIMTALLKFRTDTTPFALNLQGLIPKYSATPVKLGDKTVNGYLAWLNGDYADAMNKLGNALRDYNSEFDNWKTATGVAVGVSVAIGWIPIFGWAAVVAVSLNADALHKSFEALWKVYTDLKSANDKEAQLINHIAPIVSQFNDVDKKIQGAIHAVGELSAMLHNQADAYQGINSTLQVLDSWTSNPDAGNRKIYIESKINLTIKKLEELHTASQGFMDAIIKEEPDFLKTKTPA